MIGKKIYGSAVALMCLFYVVAAGHASVISLSAPGVNLEYLQVGVPATIVVELSDLGVDQELVLLAATIGYDQTLLSDPVVSAGEIVPDPLGTLGDFLPYEWHGTADATFTTEETQSGYHITAEGTFFSFVLTPLTVGSGSFTIDYSDAMLYDSGNPTEPVMLTLDEGQPLGFTVVVPEPSAIVLLLALAAGVCFRFSIHRTRDGDFP